MTIQNSRYATRFPAARGNLQSANGGQAAAAQSKTEFWLNFGYAQDDEKYPIVPLVRGIPLDPEHIMRVTGNSDFAVHQLKQNKLLEGFMARAKKLPEGGSEIIEFGGAARWAFEIRRVGSERSTNEVAGNDTFDPFEAMDALFDAQDEAAE